HGPRRPLPAATDAATLATSSMDVVACSRERSRARIPAASARSETDATAIHTRGLERAAPRNRVSPQLAHAPDSPQQARWWRARQRVQAIELVALARTESWQKGQRESLSRERAG